MSACMLSTVDNPWDPFEDFDRWYLWDMDHGYSSCCYLMRIARVSGELTREENEAEIERAVDEIVRFDPINVYIKVREGQKKGKKPEPGSTEAQIGKPDAERGVETAPRGA